MARDTNATPPESVISIIGPGMTIIGDCQTSGTVRVEGTVEGSIKAGKAVVVGKEGRVAGDVSTQDAVISGRVEGTLRAASRLELQATCRIDGEVHTRRMQLEEGAVLNGSVHMGSDAVTSNGVGQGSNDASSESTDSTDGARPAATLHR